jgi:hypothetical protein
MKGRKFRRSFKGKPARRGWKRGFAKAVRILISAGWGKLSEPGFV